MSVNTQQRIIEMWNGGGNLITHTAPDVDALLSTWIPFYFLNTIFGITVDEFILRVKLMPANVKVEYPDFGVDIGSDMGPNHIKEGDFPVAINGKVHTNPCASMALASMLLCERDFRAIKDMIADVHTVDTTGTAINKEQNRALVSIWGILGSLQSNLNFGPMFIVVDLMFRSMLASSSRVREDALIKLLDVQTLTINDCCVCVTPINAGRNLSEKCFHDLYANVVVWCSFDEKTNTGTVGLSVSKKFSQRYDLRSLERYPAISQIEREIGDLFFAPHICGRTTKSPIANTTMERIEYYRGVFINTITEMINNGSPYGS